MVEIRTPPTTPIGREGRRPQGVGSEGAEALGAPRDSPTGASRRRSTQFFSFLRHRRALVVSTAGGAGQRAAPTSEKALAAHARRGGARCSGGGEPAGSSLRVPGGRADTRRRPPRGARGARRPGAMPGRSGARCSTLCGERSAMLDARWGAGRDARRSVVRGAWRSTRGASQVAPARAPRYNPVQHGRTHSQARLAHPCPPASPSLWGRAPGAYHRA